jgi:hypothetical protein
MGTVFEKSYAAVIKGNLTKEQLTRICNEAVTAYDGLPMDRLRVTTRHDPQSRWTVVEVFRADNESQPLVRTEAYYWLDSTVDATMDRDPAPSTYLLIIDPLAERIFELARRAIATARP